MLTLLEMEIHLIKMNLEYKNESRNKGDNSENHEDEVLSLCFVYMILKTLLLLAIFNDIIAIVSNTCNYSS